MNFDVRIDSYRNEGLRVLWCIHCILVNYVCVFVDGELLFRKIFYTFGRVEVKKAFRSSKLSFEELKRRTVIPAYKGTSKYYDLREIG